MRCVVMTYIENQNQPNKPEGKLRDVTPETVVEIATEIGVKTNIFEPSDVLAIVAQEEFGDIAVTNGEGCWVFFSKIEE